MPRDIVGIDPGKTGAIAVFVGGELRELFDIPTLERMTGKSKLRISNAGVVSKEKGVIDVVDPKGVVAIFTHLTLTLCRPLVVLEAVGGRPHQGNMFPFGQTFGQLEASAIASGMPIEYVPASRWKVAMRCTDDKKVSCARAEELFPAWKKRFKRTSVDDGRAEAVLIGAYGVRIFGETTHMASSLPTPISLPPAA